MNKIFTVLTAALAGLSMNAQPVTYAPQIRMSAPQVNDKIINDAPDGKLTWLDRTCDGFITQAFDATHGTVRGSIVQMVECEDGSVYLSHMASEYPVNTWTRFEREGDTLVMEGVQAIYMEYDESYDEDFIVYLAPMHVVINENNVGTFVVTDDCRYVLNIGEDGSLTSADPSILLGVCIHTLNEDIEGNDVWLWKGFGDRDIKMTIADGQPVQVPENLDIYNWVIKDEYMNAFVQVAVDGEDFYVCGMDRALPDAWIKGKITDGKVVFPSGQYLGADMDIYYYSYFCGADFSEYTDEEGNEVRLAELADSAVFLYDSEQGSLTTERGYVINSTADKLYPLYFYENVFVGEQHRNPATVPEAPYDLVYNESDWGNSVWFMLPNIDVEGKLLMEDRLYYEIFVDGELQYFDITDADYNVEKTSRIPYAYDDNYDFWVAGQDHTVYFSTPVEESIGIRSVYINEIGEEIYSELGYYGRNSVKGVDSGKSVVSVRYFDLQGRSVSGSMPGVIVKVTAYGDGSMAREKIINTHF